MKHRLKGLLALTLSLIMVFATATSAWGAVWVGGTKMNANSYYVKDGSGNIMEATGTAPTDNYAYYTVDSGTDNLTLRNFSAEGHSGSAVYSDSNLNINLIGDNTLSADSSAGTAVVVAGDLEIRAEGTGASLTATGTTAGIYADGDVSISDATVTAIGTNNDSHGIIAYNGDITIENAAVYANTNAAGDYVGNYGEYGIATDDGSITITDATVDAKGSSHGIYAAENLTVTGDTTVTAASEHGSGITAYEGITIEDATVEAEGRVAIHTANGDITITDANVTATGEACGIEAYDEDAGDKGNITISGDNADVTAEGEDAGLTAEYTVSITGGNVTAEGNGYGIQGGDKVSITGGNVTAKAGNIGGVGIATRYVNSTADTSSVIHISGANTVVNVGCTTGLFAYNVEIMDNCEVNITTKTTNPAGSTSAINCNTLKFGSNWYQWKADGGAVKLSTNDQLDKDESFTAKTLTIEKIPTSGGNQGGGYPGTVMPKPPVPTTTTVASPKTFDAGIGLYIGMSVLAATGSVCLMKKED